MSSPTTTPTTKTLSKTTGHVLSILVIGIVTISGMAIAEYNHDGGFWMWMGFVSAVAAMSWHAYSLAVSTSGMNITQGNTTKPTG